LDDVRGGREEERERPQDTEKRDSERGGETEIEKAIERETSKTRELYFFSYLIGIVPFPFS
jgi:hypothetical protein